MNACIVYFSRTGNTKRLAQAIADTIKVPLFDISGALPSTIETYDLIILGTPVEGSSPAKETKAFIENMSKVEGKSHSVLHIPYIRQQPNYESDGKRTIHQRLRNSIKRFQERNEARERV